MTLLICDLSRGEYIPGTPGKVNFPEMKAAGVSAVYFRASDSTFPDTTFPTFRADCEGVLPWGAYGTIYPPSAGHSIKQQAQAFILAAGQNLGQLPLVLDWEVDGVTWQMADEYIATLEAAYPGAKILIYTRAEYLRHAMIGCTKLARFQKIGIWEAQYQTPAPSPLPVGFTMVMWQFTATADASKYGVKEAKELDLSYLYIPLADFITGAPTPTPQPLTLEQRVTALEKRMDTMDGGK